MAVAVFIAALLLCSTVLGQQNCQGEFAEALLARASSARGEKWEGLATRSSPHALDGNGSACGSCSLECEDQWGDSFCTGKALCTNLRVRHH